MKQHRHQAAKERAEQAIAQAIAHAEREGQPLSLLALDIDQFARINNTYGHDVGDIVLEDIARIVQDQIGESDTLHRWGGDEFVVLVPDVPPSDAQALAEEAPSIDRESQPGTRTGVRAAAAGGSHAGHLAAEDGAAATPSEPAEIATIDVEITREGTLRSGAGPAESSSYAAAAPVPLEGPLLMPAATLTTGTADYELSPAERNYYERYQRYREVTP